MPKHSGKKEKRKNLLFKQIARSRLTYQLISHFGLSTLNFKGQTGVGVAVVIRSVELMM